MLVSSNIGFEVVELSGDIGSFTVSACCKLVTVHNFKRWLTYLTIENFSILIDSNFVEEDAIVLQFSITNDNHWIWVTRKVDFKPFWSFVLDCNYCSKPEGDH